MKTKLPLVLLSLALPGCANVEDSVFHTKYEKTNWYNAGGYDDRMIQSDLYQVWFASNQLVKRENVDYYALVRAAEVTVIAGKEYFEVISGQDVGQTIVYTRPAMATSTTVADVNSNIYGTASTNVYGRSAQTTVNANANTTASATTTTVYSPPSESTVKLPKTLLTIRLVNQKTESAYNAKEFLLGARQKGLKLEAKF